MMLQRGILLWLHIHSTFFLIIISQAFIPKNYLKFYYLVLSPSTIAWPACCIFAIIRKPFPLIVGWMDGSTQPDLP